VTRRQFGKIAAAASAVGRGKAQSTKESEELPGVWRLRFGTPETVTPVATRYYPPAKQSIASLPPVSRSPIAFSEIAGNASERGFEVSLPLGGGELLYGLGLQFDSLLQRGRKKKLRVNADPVADIGDSHAPVPLYVSSAGYAVLIDSARYVNIYCGNKVKKHEGQTPSSDTNIGARVSQLPPAYERYHMAEQSEVLVEIPKAQGVDVYVFAGPTLREAIQRYVLFSGGGALPPRWGLGFWYRCYGKFNQQEVLKIADELRRESIPCDVLGLEPGWQSHSYSCSFVWSDLFPAPAAMISGLKNSNYQVNLWEHAFTHPSSPLHQPLYPLSGDYEVWDGLVPDFLDPRARDIFGGYHEREFVAKGISGFKLDECDNSDYTGNWSFPELSRFPSQADGEQMHSLFGLHYQQTIQSAYDRHGVRTFGLVRSSHALAAPLPYVLYSDLYDHRQFVRALVNSGFSGLLWCPEVRDAVNEEDLVRRLQTVIFSPLAMVNAWYIKNPPWKQVDREANNAGHFSEGWQNLQALCRKMIEVRMQMIPYLYAAFVRYRQVGVPPVRALVVDYPKDAKGWTVDDQYMFGEDLLVAPVFAGQKQRSVYLPEGDWFDFWTGSKIFGAQTVTVTPSLETIPVFVKSGTILPLAQPTLHTNDPSAFKLVVRAYGGSLRTATLYEDDGSADPKITPVTIEWNLAADSGSVKRSGPEHGSSYTVIRWERAG
jgi:alpha-D-xyloside xylohydrolase